MPLLSFEDAHGDTHRISFAEMTDIHIGADAEWSDVQFSGDFGVAPRHAIITRSALNRLLMIVDLSERQTWVNQHPVIDLRILRQGDIVRVGQGAFTVWEVQIQQLAEGDAAIGQKCPVSRRIFQAGDEVIGCPGCGTMHERDAWFLVQHCAAGCGYPNREVIMDTLPAGVLLERSIDRDSRLVERIENGRTIQEGQRCGAGQARDQVPFQEGQNVVYCPSCQTPFHLECFLTLETCPVCQYAVSELVNKTFMFGG